LEFVIERGEPQVALPEGGVGERSALRVASDKLAASTL
jgi:hypothetical protein